ncbi:hypothetical protein AVEN_143095-1 [Araneus ventricosus]|uniref:Paired domain-containing protein n=1 Tax=Araneus ventricosus TaxID=182803 RepID=A0A4Y2L6N9_ARAVE|nr:hypothetical protein AVEN_143095-1 [Araneus ventricosus]
MGNGNGRCLVTRWLRYDKSVREIAAMIGKSYLCVQKVLQKYWKTGFVPNNPKRGRQEILKATAKRKIIRPVKKNPKLSTLNLYNRYPQKLEEESWLKLLDVFFIMQDSMVVLRYPNCTLIISI